MTCEHKELVITATAHIPAKFDEQGQVVPDDDMFGQLRLVRMACIGCTWEKEPTKADEKRILEALTHGDGYAL